ncbi:MAG: glycosyltransferase family 2 protein [Acidobacteria bacterium]|nr:glycosyltransferase family 2 protein [Acidobacteriota bacterium]
MDASVVIPTHNKKRELERCLEAVLAQQFSGVFEVLVCDDGSDDGTAEMLREWWKTEPRLQYLAQTRRGPAAVRNLGIRHARGPLIAMTDDDTIPDARWLDCLCAAAQRPGVVGVEGRVTPGRSFGPCETAPSNEAGGVYLTCNALYRRDVLARVGGFDERFPFAAFEDCDLAARIRQHGAIAWSPEAVVTHPPRRSTWRSTLQRLRHWPWIMVTARRYGYLGWPGFPTRRPRARVIWNSVVKLPAGRLLSALRAMPNYPGQAIHAALWAALEPLAALFRAVPEVLRCDLDSAALQMDYLKLIPPSAKVALVVVHYKQPEMLLRCIRSFGQVDYPNLKMIVVESAAKEERLLPLRTELPGVEWVVASENVGYSGGNNLGINRALDHGCEYILLANADTECIAPDCISRLVRFLELNPKVALAGPRVYLRGRDQVQNTVLRYPSLWRNLVDWFGFRLLPRLYARSGEAVRSAEMLNGVCVMLRAAAIRQVGAFDPQFFMYVEDADLGLRLRNAGWEIAYVPIDSIIHHQKETSYDLEGEVSLLVRRNAVYFLKKHRHRMQAWGLAAANLLLALARTCATTSMEKFRRRLAFLQALWRELRAVLQAASPEAPGAR